MAKIIKKLLAAAIGFTPVGTLVSTTVQAALAELDVRAATPGDVKYVAYATAPTGWLKANGALVSRTTYAALFAKIGTTFGAGDGSTTFALPDLRGEFIRGFDDGRGVDASRAIGSAQADMFKAHTHDMGYSDGVNGAGAASQNLMGPTPRGLLTGSTGGTETRPRNVALLAVIKY